MMAILVVPLRVSGVLSGIPEVFFVTILARAAPQAIRAPS